MTGISLAPIGILLIVACLIAMLSRRIGLPYIVGLLLAGFLIALLPNSPDLVLSRDLIFNILLPPLVFEGALQLDWRRFRNELPLTLSLAFLGVALAGSLVACGMHWIIGWSWIGAGLFGALIAATDPVSVIATFRRLDCLGRVSVVVEAESLLNDGAAAVAFAVLSALGAGASPTLASVAPDFLWTLCAGIIVGLGVSGATLLVAGRTNDPLVEITLTTIAAYASFLIAEHVHASGVISALCAGLLIGSVGNRFFSDAGRERVGFAWDYFAFLANSFVFILIGTSIAHQPLHQLGYEAAAAAVILVLASRLLSVYPLSALFRWSRWRLQASFQHALVWGGMRGALALALALAVPPSVAERGSIILAAFVVVAFSVLVQGLTMPWLMRRLDLAQAEERLPHANAEATRST
ncbi:MAG TPA: sodium:proton antiporter [Sphingomicrobium sp.]|nr:sodium:proton antiporter [Sphingomicrobium sp.]